MRPRLIEQLVFLVLVGGLLGWVVVESSSFPSKAGVYPWAVGVLGVVLVVVEIILTLTRKSKASEDVDEVSQLGVVNVLGKVGPYLLWLAGYYLLIYLFGLVVASALFVFAFLSLVAKARWYLALGAAGVLVAFLLGVSELLNLYWPDAWVMNWLQPVLDRFNG